MLALTREILSGPDGTISSTRLLMYVFSFFSMGIIGGFVYRVFHLTDPVIISIYLSNLPTIIASLLGLIALPYGINKGTATFSDIANMVTATRSRNVIVKESSQI